MPRRGAENQRPSRAREELAWSLRARGRTQEEIAAELEIDQSSVSRMLQKVAKRRLDQLPELVDEQRSLIHSRLELLFCEAMTAWQAGKDAGKGNPRLLDVARGVISDLRKLYGIDAPEKHIVGAVGGDLTPEKREEILRRMGLLPDQVPVPAPAPIPAPAPAATPQPVIDLGAAIDAIAATLPPTEKRE
jgi:hypothetical protein